jgi:acetyl esterase/lipase
MKRHSALVSTFFLLISIGARGQEAVVSPPETLVVEGGPNIPLSLAETAGRYGAYRSAGMVDWHPSQRAMLISTRFAETPQLHVVSAPGAERQQLTFYTDAVRVGRFHPDGGDYIAFSKDIGGGEWYQLYRYTVATGDVALLTDGKSHNLLGPWSSKGDQIAYMSTRRTGKDMDLWVMNPAKPSSDHLLTQLSGGGWEPLDWSSDDSKILFKTDAFPEAQLVNWKSFDGRMISGSLYRPPLKFTGKRPVLVVIHGGPEGQSQPVFIGRSNYYLNEMGIALIYPNVRGSTGYGKTFSLLDNGFGREDTYKDINALFDWIAAQPDLDSSRIAVTGGSYGGHMTLVISTFYSDRIRCSVDIVGMSNLVTFLEHTEAYRRDLRRVEYGDERDPKMRDFLERIAPMNNIIKIKKSLMVVAGKNDPRVPLSESDQIVAALKQQGTPVWYVMAKDEGHGFQKNANQDYQFYATVEFLREFLLK